jgi:hypothetical protein
VLIEVEISAAANRHNANIHNVESVCKQCCLVLLVWYSFSGHELTMKPLELWQRLCGGFKKNLIAKEFVGDAFYTTPHAHFTDERMG